MSKQSPVTELIHAVSDDPEVKAAARQLALTAIAEAQYLVLHGAPAVRASMLKSILPTAFAGMREAALDQNAEEARAQMEAILAEMRSTA